MKNQKLMTRKDKYEYFKYYFKIILYRIIFAIVCVSAMFGIFVLVSIEKNQKFIPLPWCLTFILIGIIIYCIPLLKVLRVFYKKEVYIIDGHIFKKHLNNWKTDDGRTNSVNSARAISEDKSISTKWINYPKRYFKLGNPKVKIVIYKGKAIDFYLDKESVKNN